MSRSALASSVLSYAVKVWIGGLIAAVFVPLSLAALAVDVILMSEDPLSERVLDASARVEAALDIHGDRTDIRVVETAQAA